MPVNFTDNSKLYGLLISLFSITLISIYGFRQYIFEDYIYFQHAHDMAQVVLPIIIEMHYQIYDGASIMWSFYQGLGSPIFTENPNMHGDIFAWLLAAFPIDIIPQGIIFVHILKFIMSTGLFYIYLCEFKTLSMYTRIIGALFYACSGVMLCRGAWWHYATEVVMIVPFLIGLEKWHRNHKALFIIPAFTALLISRYVTYAYIYTLYAFGYLILRYYFHNKFSIASCLSLIKSFFPYYVMSLFLSAVFLLPGILSFLTSARGINVFQANIFLQRDITIIANFLKLFQPNITGIMHTGSVNILEDLCGYSGVLILLLLIYSLLHTKLSYICKLFICFCILYFVFRFPVLLFNGFAYASTKTSSIWLNVSMILLSIYFLQKKYFSVKIKTVISVMVMFILLAYIYQQQSGLLLYNEFYYAYILILVYSILLYIIQKRHISNLKILLVIMVFLECCISTNLSTKYYAPLLPFSQKNIWQDTFYRGNLPKQISNGFSRISIINKANISTSEASISRYYGFCRYASVNPKFIVQLADTFNAGFLLAKSHFILGLERYHGIRNMLSAAYIGDARTNTFIKNEDFVPLGYLYDLQISEGELKNYPVNIRDDIFSKAAILDTPVDSINNYEDFYSVNKLQEQSLSIVDTNCLQNEAGADTHVITGDDPFIIYAVNNVNASGKEIISLEPDITVFNKEGKQIQDLPVQIFYAGEDRIFTEENSFYSSIRNGQLQIYLSDDINASNVKFIRIDLGSKEQRLRIGDVKLCTYKVSLKTAAPQQEYIPYVPLNRNSVCQQESFSDTEIHLRATTDAPKVLFLSIPYDKGWSIYDNGKELDVMHVNIGFIGAYLEPGEHELLVKYRIPGLYEGAAISGITALILLLVWFKRRRNCPAR